jgi:hypothetical protein
MSANFLLNDTDHYIKDVLGIRFARYVDDYCLIDSDKDRLLAAVPLIREHLLRVAGVKLHPHKFYMQHYTKGVKFIGVVIKPGRIYISNRTVANAYRRIHYFNTRVLERGFTCKNAESFASSLNSYLGIMKHYSTYSIRRRLIGRISPEWLKVVVVAPDLAKITVKKRYTRREQIRRRLKRERHRARHFEQS